MPSKNRIAAYPPDHIHQRLKDFAKEQGVSESKALIQVLGEYFGVPTKIGQEVAHRYITTEKFESEIEKLNSLIDDLKDDIATRTADTAAITATTATAGSDVKGQGSLFEASKTESESMPLKEKSSSDSSLTLTGSQLSKRLGKSQKYATNQKGRHKGTADELAEKLQKLDPDNYLWWFDSLTKKWVNKQPKK